ncbi:hypothetical protein BDV93DRAFT_507761 [Ceratobasidium sp. AG-I]|nr:hypothetical protein BDV93DRAFT_507761 [Ceratobasidium sp. AG-I]
MKCLIGSNGYPASSSDESNTPQPNAKKAKSLYQPFRMSTASERGASPFMFPERSTPVPCGSVTNTIAPTSKLKYPSTSVTPAGNYSDDKEGSTISPLAPSGKKENTPEPQVLPSLPYKGNRSRAILVLQSTMNKIKSMVDSLVTNMEALGCTNKEQFAQVLAQLNNPQRGEQGSGPSTSNKPTTTDRKADLVNPPVTTELDTMVTRNRDNGSRANTMRWTGRRAADGLDSYGRVQETPGHMTPTTAAKEIGSHFTDKNNKPDTLPVQFVDPVTGYCQPYPHWRAALNKQLSWIPTYILCFRKTISADNTEGSQILCCLTNKQIVMLLHDGPFKSAQTKWRDSQKTAMEIAEMQALARRHARAYWTSVSHHSHVSNIESLKGLKYGYLYQPGYVSPEGSGKKKDIVHIAACGISKAWHKKYSTDFENGAYLINNKASTNPDINNFLDQHPPLHEDDDVDSESDDMVGSPVQDISQISKGKGKGRGCGIGKESMDELESIDKGADEGGMGMSMGNNVEDEEDYNNDIPIDPVLRLKSKGHAAQSSAQDRPHPKMRPVDGPSGSTVVHAPIPVLNNQQTQPDPLQTTAQSYLAPSNAPHSFLLNDMPPPPIIPSVSTLETAQDNLAHELPPTQPKHQPTEKQPNANTTSSNLSVPKKRNRGCPKGSKNKPKNQMEEILEEKSS